MQNLLTAENYLNGNFELSFGEFDFILKRFIFKDEEIVAQANKKNLKILPLCCSNQPRVCGSSSEDVFSELKLKDITDTLILVVPYMLENFKFVHFEIAIMPSSENRYSVLVKVVSPDGNSDEFESEVVTKAKEDIQRFFVNDPNFKCFGDDANFIFNYDDDSAVKQNQSSSGSAFYVLQNILGFAANLDYKIEWNANVSKLKAEYLARLFVIRLNFSEDENKILEGIFEKQFNSTLKVLYPQEVSSFDSKQVEGLKAAFYGFLNEGMRQVNSVSEVVYDTSDVRSKVCSIYTIPEETEDTLKAFNTGTVELYSHELDIQDWELQIRNCLKGLREEITGKIEEGYKSVDNRIILDSDSRLIGFRIDWSENYSLFIKLSREEPIGAEFILENIEDSSKSFQLLPINFEPEDVKGIIQFLESGYDSHNSFYKPIGNEEELKALFCDVDGDCEFSIDNDSGNEEECKEPRRDKTGIEESEKDKKESGTFISLLEGRLSPNSQEDVYQSI